MTVIKERVIPEERNTALAARRAMIDSQLRTSGVSEPWILDAMGALAREDFVPETMREAAYIDRAIPLENGHMLAAPVVHGRMLAEARPQMSDKALLIGHSDGYLAALLRHMVGSLDVLNPGEAAAKGGGDYSLIVIDGAAEVLPDALAGRLADDGRLVTGQVLRGVTRIATGRKVAGAIALLPLAEIGIPVLPEFAAPRRWSF
jgi:protein-L-isoaspartate(D-aspartate) O-methyltransferase